MLKKLTLVSLSLLLLASTAILLASTASAAIKNGGYLVQGSVGYAGLENKASKNWIDGAVVGLEWEYFALGDLYTFGLGLNYMGGRDTYERSNGTQVRDEFTSMPIYLMGKAYIGSPEGSIHGFIGVRLGWHFSNIKRVEEGAAVVSESVTEPMGAMPMGVIWFPGNNDLFFNLNYAPTFMGSSNYENNFVHQVSLGIGFGYNTN